MADTVQGKAVYSGIMNRWIFGATADGRKSSIFKDGYDDPTYMTFKVEFGEWGASVLDRSVVQNGLTEFGLSFNDYDQLPVGLLNCPYEGSNNQDKYWQTNTDYKVFNNTKFYSAFQYLRSRNEDTRAKYLYYFVNGLYEIQHDYPFVFKKISGINELEKFDPVSGQRLKGPVKITLECYEGLDLKIRTLFEFYRKAAWDDVYQRWILPENMREFKMIIYIFERRVFQDTEMFTVDDQKHMKMSFGKLNADIPVKAYECMPCEFSIGDSISWNGEYSSALENSEESSKLVINVKNVKTYFKNNLFNDELSKIYNNNGKSSNNLQDRIDSIMIYDLVEEMERNNGKINEAENIAEYSSTNFTNMTVNGVKAMFLDKRILLENEEANMNIKSYVWGNSAAGAFYSDGDKVGKVNEGRRDYTLSWLEDNTSYRGGWVFSLASGPTYDENKSFWSNLGDNIKNVITGTRRLILMSGAANLQIIPNCLIDSIFIPPHVFDAIDYYDNGFGYLKPKDLYMKSREIDEQSYLEIEEERYVPDQIFSELTSRDISKQQYKDIEPEREIPKQEYKDLEPERVIPEQQFDELSSRTVPKQSFDELKPERVIPPQGFGTLSNRIILPQEFKPLSEQRDIPEQDYRNLDPERDLPEQKFKDLEKERNTDSELMNLLLVARSLPGFKDLTIEDVRKIPKQDLLELKDAEERSMPAFKADQSVLLNSVKDIEGTNVKLLELDKDNKIFEERALELLKQNQALSKFELIETDKESPDEKAEKLKKLTIFTKDFVENSDKVRQAYVNNILEMKNDLRETTIDIINHLPQNDTYIIKEREVNKEPLLNDVMISQNDIDQINHNMKFLAINDKDVEKLSFQTLISIQDELSDAVQRSHAVNGLTEIVKNSVATNPDKSIRNAAKESVIKEQKKDKMKVIY